MKLLEKMTENPIKELRIAVDNRAYSCFPHVYKSEYKQIMSQIFVWISW